MKKVLSISFNTKPSTWSDLHKMGVQVCDFTNQKKPSEIYEEWYLQEPYKTIRPRYSQLGFGSRGRVYECSKSKNTAIKEMFRYDQSHDTNDEEAISVLNEVFFQQKVSVALQEGPRFHKIILTDSRYFILMDKIEGMTLEELVLCNQWSTKPARERIEFLVKITKTLKQISQLGIYHRDFKECNIMVQDDGRPVLIDFGGSTTDRAWAYLDLHQLGRVILTVLVPESFLDRNTNPMFTEGSKSVLTKYMSDKLHLSTGFPHEVALTISNLIYELYFLPSSEKPSLDDTLTLLDNVLKLQTD